MKIEINYSNPLGTVGTLILSFAVLIMRSLWSGKFRSCAPSKLKEIAEVPWQAHKKRNDSFIVDLFQGQYKSILVYPECGKVSITLDPFMHLLVSLPKKRRVLPDFFPKDYYSKPVKAYHLQRDLPINKKMPRLAYSKGAPLSSKSRLTISQEIYSS